MGCGKDMQKESHEGEQLMLRMSAILDAVPVCVSLWNSSLQNIMWNQKAIELFGLKNKQQCCGDFFKLSPEYQPDGVLSCDMASEKLNEAFKTGFSKFNWLHFTLNGEEIPAEITLSKISTPEDGNEFVAGFVKDLRTEFSDNNTDEFDDYFLNYISDKDLLKSITALSDDLFFALDIRTSSIQYFGDMSKLLAFNDRKALFPEHLIEHKTIYEEDIPLILELEQNIKKGISKPIDLRLHNLAHGLNHCRVIYYILFNKKREAIFAVGKVFDINEQKKLEVEAKTDLLTNCYNKMSSEFEISEILFESTLENQHVFFIIDIDNFKSINDNLGHHFGDLVLTEVANNLKSNFRSQDIVGRIGGDEFIGFVKGIKDIKAITGKAKSILGAFSNTFSGDTGVYNISGSIGISIFPNDGTTYEELYKSADRALYQSKKQGKNCYTFYNKHFLEGTMKNWTISDNASRVAKSYFDAELISLIFDLLYETNDIRSSINAVLKILGTKMSVDRSYIFETFDGGKTYDNTYEWCRPTINSEIDNLQGITGDTLKDFFETANQEGVVYSNDLSVLLADGAHSLMADQGIKSFLHAQIKSKDGVKGFVGFDDCTKPRIWNENEINTILYATKIISTFLLIDNGQIGNGNKI